MSGLVSAVATIVIGAIVVRLVSRGDHLAYVKDSLTLPLLVAAAVLVVVGGFHWWRELAALGRDRHHQDRQHQDQDPQDHDSRREDHERRHTDRPPGAHPHGDHHHGEHPHAQHRHGPVSWALLAAFALLAAVPPTPLGPGAAPQLDGASQFTARSYAPLADGTVHAMPLREYWERAHFDTDRSLQGKVVRLVGFVARPGTTTTYGEVANPEPAAGPAGTASPPPGSGSAPDDGWTLTRMSIACCAADAVAVRVRIVPSAPGGGAGPGAARAQPPAPGQWVTVEGSWAPHPGAPTGTPLPPSVLVAATITPIPAPRSPYE